MSEITVVIPFYNPGKYLVDAIESVVNQTCDNWNLLLINDCSTVHTPSLITPYLSDPRVKLLEHQINLGQSAALNTGLQKTETPYLLHLDADDWLYPYTLETLLQKAQQLPEDVGVIGGNVNIVWEFKQKIYKSRIYQGRGFSNKYEFLLANHSVWPRFYRTEILKKIGGWPMDDPWKGRHAEDIRILSRIIENYQINWIDKLLLFHRRYQGNQSNQTKLYGEVIEWIVQDNLTRWGSKYRPLFKKHPNGWTQLVEIQLKKEGD
jgi:glycosyltransferase involved in cell wall biosynthesis